MKSDELRLLLDVAARQEELDRRPDARAWEAPRVALEPGYPVPRKRAAAVLRKWSRQKLYTWHRDFAGTLNLGGLAVAARCRRVGEAIREADGKLVRLEFITDSGPRPNWNEPGFREHRGYYDSGPVVGIFEDQGDNGLHLFREPEIRRFFCGGMYVPRAHIAWLEVIQDAKKFAKIEALYNDKFMTKRAFAASA